MGSTARDATGMKTSFDESSATSHDRADSGNNAMMLRRKIRMGAKAIRQSFRDLDRLGNGVLLYDDLRYALHRMDIDLTNKQFDDLMKQIDHNGDGNVSYAEFLDFFHKEDEGLGLTKVRVVAVVNF